MAQKQGPDIKSISKKLNKLPILYTYFNTPNQLKLLKLTYMYIEMILVKENEDYKEIALYKDYIAFQIFVEAFKNRFQNENIINEDGIDESHPFIILFYSYYATFATIFGKLADFGNFIEDSLPLNILNYLTQFDIYDINELLQEEGTEPATKIIYAVTFKNIIYQNSVFYKYCKSYMNLIENIRIDIPVSLWRFYYKGSKHKRLNVWLKPEKDQDYWDFSAYRVALTHLLENMLKGTILNILNPSDNQENDSKE